MHCEDARVGGHCLIVLQSDDCLFRFVYDRGTVEISVGTLSAPIGWTNPDQDVGHWFDLMWIIHFVEGRPQPTSEELRQMGEALWSMTTDERLATFSRMLRPVCGQVVELFREDVFKERREAFEQFYYS